MPSEKFPVPGRTRACNNAQAIPPAWTLHSLCLIAISSASEAVRV